MSQTKLSVFFKMQQKDDKKEILKFEIKAQQEESEAAANKLYSLAGSIILFEVEGCDVGETPAEFMNIQRDSKKITLKFAIKAGADKKTQELYKFAGRNVNLTVQASQMSIEEFYEEHEGIEYSVDGEGNVEVPKDQLSIDDVPEEDENKEEKEMDPFEEQELY